MDQYFSNCIYLVLVCGFALVINNLMVTGQPTVHRHKRQFNSTPSWSNGLFNNAGQQSQFQQLLSNFGDGSNVTTNVTYKSVVRKVITLPDGTVKTEEVVHNSGEGPQSFATFTDGDDKQVFQFSYSTDLSGLFNSDSLSDFHKRLKESQKVDTTTPKPEKLCNALKPKDVYVSCKYQGQSITCDQRMRPGTIATQQCYRYYKQSNNKQNPRLTCLENGRWDADNYIYCIPVCGASKELGVNTPLIVDGRPANVGTFPWHAGLYMRIQKNGQELWDQQCGGTLISDRFVLTAAHCVINRDEKDVRVALGKLFRPWDQYEETEQKRNVARIAYPQDFHRATLYFDIALLLLDKTVKLGEFVLPVCSSLLDGSNSILNKRLYIAGWGRTVNEVGGSSSNTLLYNDLKFVPPNTCQKLIPSTISLFDKFCTLKNDDSEVSIAQPGDSGGGLSAVFDGLHYIFGIVSGKLNQVTTFTNITWPTHIVWMEKEIKRYDPNFRV